MDIAQAPTRFGHHGNAFGLLRLVLASLVIVSHTPELVDGDGHRELLHRAFGTLSFGGLAVDGFFLVSGFLITASFLSSPSVFDYFVKRVARIYPAFIVSSLICLLVVLPLSGARIEPFGLHVVARTGLHLALLRRPFSYGAFPGDPHSDLNAAAWTIQYAFACYLLIVMLGFLGVLRRGLPLFALTAGLILAASLPGDPWEQLHPQTRDLLFSGPGVSLLRLPGLFLAGACFRHIQHRLVISWQWAAIAVPGLLVCLCYQVTTEPGIAVFGGYLLFAAATAGGATILARVNDRNDISYGLYLYAWPVEKLLIWHRVTGNLLWLGTLTWIIAAALGWLDWHAVEKPALRAGRRLLQRRTR